MWINVFSEVTKRVRRATEFRSIECRSTIHAIAPATVVVSRPAVPKTQSHLGPRHIAQRNIDLRQLTGLHATQSAGACLIHINARNQSPSDVVLAWRKLAMLRSRARRLGDFDRMDEPQQHSDWAQIGAC